MNAMNESIHKRFEQSHRENEKQKKKRLFQQVPPKQVSKTRVKGRDPSSYIEIHDVTYDVMAAGSRCLRDPAF